MDKKRKKQLKRESKIKIAEHDKKCSDEKYRFRTLRNPYYKNHPKWIGIEKSLFNLDVKFRDNNTDVYRYEYIKRNGLVDYTYCKPFDGGYYERPEAYLYCKRCGDYVPSVPDSNKRCSCAAIEFTEAGKVVYFNIEWVTLVDLKGRYFDKRNILAIFEAVIYLVVGIFKRIAASLSQQFWAYIAPKPKDYENQVDGIYYDGIKSYIAKDLILGGVARYKNIEFDSESCYEDNCSPFVLSMFVEPSVKRLSRTVKELKFEHCRSVLKEFLEIKEFEEFIKDKNILYKIMVYDSSFQDCVEIYSSLQSSIENIKEV